ncbi:uncharacterized protein BO95DRAFT_426926 [Aspergillus brunneoviolaceus CBS 621.78]|uniref:Uncharacterized protein n=1 Tax=Aspergillus brunneoviolaceus CBS 621.78 TaxID=1450534 RepID=A0ACD1GPR7_9EURO|nr:hypothetical protein BO95DRAFT_426926 [Aspergillus brunneoviolaceus CBS 621.78]RAH51109.1 hypothetical protein BO95DRAFT_426926 [Aspergillus brunneoviolaceus CBS 621.78]
MCAPVFPDLFEHEEDIDQDEAIRTGEVINQATPPLRTWRKGTALPIFYRHGHESDEDYSDTDSDTLNDLEEAETGDNHVDAETGDGQGEGQSQHDGYRDGSTGGVYLTRYPVQVVGLTFSVGGRVVFLLQLRCVRYGRDEVEDEPREECEDADGQEGEYEDHEDDEGDEGDDEYEEDEEEYGGGGGDDDDGDGDYPSDSDSDHHQHLYGEDEYVCILPDCPERLLIIQERLETRRDFFRDAMMIMHGKYAHLLDVSEMGDDAQGYFPTEKPWESEEARLEWEGFLNRVPQLVCCDADNNLPCSIDDINDFYALRAWMLELLPWVVESPPLAISISRDWWPLWRARWSSLSWLGTDTEDGDYSSFSRCATGALGNESMSCLWMYEVLSGERGQRSEAIQTVILMTEPSMAASQAPELKNIMKEMRALLDRLDALEDINTTNDAKDATIHGTDSETLIDYTQPVKERGPRVSLNDVLEWFNLRSATYNHERATVFTPEKFPKMLWENMRATRGVEKSQITRSMMELQVDRFIIPALLQACGITGTGFIFADEVAPSKRKEQPRFFSAAAPEPADTVTVEQSGPAGTQRLRMCATPMLQMTHLADKEETSPFFLMTARPDRGEAAKADFTMALAIADHNNKLKGKNRILYGMLVAADIVTFAEVSEDVISYGPEVEFAKEEDVVRVCKHVAELLTRVALLGTLLSS